eukprot:gene24608-10226_t
MGTSGPASGDLRPGELVRAGRSELDPEGGGAHQESIDEGPLIHIQGQMPDVPQAALK